jgi:hypothetical protein
MNRRNLPWIYSQIAPMYRFEPLPEGMVAMAVRRAWEEDLRQELRDHEWPCPWWDEERERRYSGYWSDF